MRRCAFAILAFCVGLAAHAADVPIVTQLESDMLDPTAPHPGSSLDVGMGPYKWSDGLDQHDNAHYVIPTEHQLIVGTNAFLGSSLTLEQEAVLLLNACSFDMGSAPLRLGTNSTVQTIVSNEVLSIRTPTMELTGGADTWAHVKPQAPNAGLRFEGGFTGDANLRLKGGDLAALSAVDSVMPVAFDAESPDYRGAIEVCPADGHDDQSAGKPQSKVVLSIRSALALGGPCAEFNADSFVLHGNQTLRIMEDTTFDVPTRGLVFHSLDNGAPCYLDVPTNVAVSIRQPLKFHGALRKVGAGLLKVGGTHAVAFADSADGVPHTPTNVLVISEGSLKPASTNALDGLDITFEKGTKLVLDADVADDAVRMWGLYNTKWSKPLHLGVGVSVLDVEFAYPKGYELPPSNERIAICTVPAGFDELTVDSFRIGPIGDRHGAVGVTEDVLRGTKTFYADFQSTGTSVIVR